MLKNQTPTESSKLSNCEEPSDICDTSQLRYLYTSSVRIGVHLQPKAAGPTAGGYHTRHGFGTTIFASFLQLKLLANSGKSCSTELVRYSSGACVFVCACVRNCSGRVCVHHCCAYATQNRCSGA